MKNLNAEQVKKALECCHSCNEADCKNCGYRQKAEGVEDLYISCTNILIADALALINSQEQRIGELSEEVEDLKVTLLARTMALTTLKAVKKELTEDKEKLGYLIDELVKEKRELWEENKKLTEENERLRAIPERICEQARQMCFIVGDEEYVTLCELDQIAKEMLEGDNEN